MIMRAIHWLFGTNWPDIETPNGRRAWAFLATVGAGMTFTILIMWAMYHVRNQPFYIFSLGIAAHIAVFFVLGALGWVMGRRMAAEWNKEGGSFDDREQGGKG